MRRLLTTRRTFSLQSTSRISAIRGTVRGGAPAAAERIRAGARAPGVAQLFTPGEPEWTRRQGAAGQMMLPPAVASTLLRLAKELRVPAGAFAPAEKYERT